MVKKNLTDLLQEETKPFTPSPDDSTIEVTAEKVLETESEEVEKTPAKKSSPTSTKSKTPTKADLEVKIKELQENLQKSQRDIQKSQNQELELREEITDLKTALSEQKTLAEKLAKELYETKKTALQLAESNSKLIAEMQDMKSKPAPEPEPEPKPQQQTRKRPIQPVKDSSKSLVFNPHRAYRPAPRVVMKESDNKDEFQDNTWLLD